MEPKTINWREMPFARLLIPLIIGIVLGIAFPYSAPFLYVILFILLAANIGLVLTQLSFRFRWISGGVLYLFFGLCGHQLASSNDALKDPNHFAFQHQEATTIIGCVTATPTIKKRVKLVLEVKHILKDSSIFIPATGNLLLYFEKEEGASQLQYGDRLIVQLQAFPVKVATNPKAFDYKQYLAYRHIHHQAFAEKGEWQKLGSGFGNPIYQRAYRLQAHFMELLRQNLHLEGSFEVGCALLLGHRAFLTTDLQEAYATSGAIHVLAVSGLHVGMIFMVLQYLLKWLPKNR